MPAFRAHGFDAEVAPLTAANAADAAHDPALVARIARFGSVYFTGGDQAQDRRGAGAGRRRDPGARGDPAAQAAGGLLAGSSAGAAMMSQPMILGGTSIEVGGPRRHRGSGGAGAAAGRGPRLLSFGMVDQHFIKRGRLARLVVAMAAAGIRRGFGIDENTALLVEGATGRVCGEYGMMVVDLGRRRSTGAAELPRLPPELPRRRRRIDLARASSRGRARRSGGCGRARSPTAPRPGRGATPSAPTRSTT